MLASSTPRLGHVIAAVCAPTATFCVHTGVVQRVVGLVIVAVGFYLVASPYQVAYWLGKPHDTTSQVINLRASWGGAVVGIGAFVAWLPALRPWLRAFVGLVMWTMAGVGIARLIGFAFDGDPDDRQLIWITAEAALVIGGALALRRLRR